jgi:hypothetical protein
MRSRTKQVAVTVLIGQYLLFALYLVNAQERSVSVAATISLEKNVITLHEPVLISLAFVNSSDHDVVISLGYDADKMQIKVIDPDGHVFHKPESILKSGWRFPDTVQVAGGATAFGSVPLNNWFTFDKTGIYKIEASLSPFSSSKEHFSYSIHGNHATLSLRILPRDERALVTECAGLLVRTQALDSYASALVAAKALSKIDDPVAIPFLAEALKRKEFTGLMIDSLARIKTDKAIDALVSASQSSDLETKGLAHSALLGLGVAKNE